MALYTPDYDILVVGAGDFSFELALYAQLLAVHTPGYRGVFVATSLDSHETLVGGYSKVHENIQSLSNLGAEIFCQVDATNLKAVPALQNRSFDRILFNFPHSGQRPIDSNRLLLRNFFESAEPFLKPEASTNEVCQPQIHVTLARGQGGTKADAPRASHNHWQVVQQATYSGLILAQVFPFERRNYVGYEAKGCRTSDKHFDTPGALVHCFARQSSALPGFLRLQRNSTSFPLSKRLTSFPGLPSSTSHHERQEYIVDEQSFARDPEPCQTEDVNTNTTQISLRNSARALPPASLPGKPNKVQASVDPPVYVRQLDLLLLPADPSYLEPEPKTFDTDRHREEQTVNGAGEGKGSEGQDRDKKAPVVSMQYVCKKKEGVA